MKKSSVHNILRKDIHLTPYKRQASQKLREGDNIKRLSFCPIIEEMIAKGELDLLNIALLMRPMLIRKTFQINRTMTNCTSQNQRFGLQFLFTPQKSLFGAGWLQWQLLARTSFKKLTQAQQWLQQKNGIMICQRNFFLKISKRSRAPSSYKM